VGFILFSGIGSGLSEKVKLVGETRAAKWSLLDYVDDAKRAIDYLLEQTQASQVHLVRDRMQNVCSKHR
jgi:hypothetical protein